MASPRAISATSVANSPRAGTANTASPKNEEMDLSLLSWVTNTHSVLHWPLTILIVAGLLVLGSFIEIAPRKSLEFLDNSLGRALFFIIPFLIAILIDWPTGLLAATVSLIIFARLQKEDSSEGFSDGSEDHSTKLISNSHRWFIERVMGERPLAISSDRAQTTLGDDDIRTASSSKTSLIPSDSFWSKFDKLVSASTSSTFPSGSPSSRNDGKNSSTSSSMPVGSSSSSQK